jgi:hypothetical protein
MNTDEFATITQNVIAANGFEDFQPTACFPKRRAVRSLAGFPSDEDPELPALEWATGVAHPGEEFLVAFKCHASHFKVIRQDGELQESKVYAVPNKPLQVTRETRAPERRG